MSISRLEQLAMRRRLLVGQVALQRLRMAHHTLELRRQVVSWPVAQAGRWVSRLAQSSLMAGRALRWWRLIRRWMARTDQ